MSRLAGEADVGSFSSDALSFRLNQGGHETDTLFIMPRTWNRFDLWAHRYHREFIGIIGATFNPGSVVVINSLILIKLYIKMYCS